MGIRTINSCCRRRGGRENPLKIYVSFDMDQTVNFLIHRRPGQVIMMKKRGSRYGMGYVLCNYIPY